MGFSGGGVLQAVHEPGEFHTEFSPSQRVRGKGAGLGIASGLQQGAASVGEPNYELAPVPRMACPGDQPRTVKPLQDPADGLASDVDSGGQLFLVEGAVSEPAHGNGRGAG